MWRVSRIDNCFISYLHALYIQSLSFFFYFKSQPRNKLHKHERSTFLLVWFTCSWWAEHKIRRRSGGTGNDVLHGLILLRVFLQLIIKQSVRKQKKRKWIVLLVQSSKSSLTSSTRSVFDLCHGVRKQTDSDLEEQTFSHAWYALCSRSPLIVIVEMLSLCQHCLCWDYSDDTGWAGSWRRSFKIPPYNVCPNLSFI